MGDESSSWVAGRARSRSGWTSGRRGRGRPAALLHGRHEHLYDGGISDQGDDPKPALTPGAAQSIDVPGSRVILHLAQRLRRTARRVSLRW